MPSQSARINVDTATAADYDRHIAIHRSRSALARSDLHSTVRRADLAASTLVALRTRREVNEWMDWTPQPTTERATSDCDDIQREIIRTYSHSHVFASVCCQPKFHEMKTRACWSAAFIRLFAALSVCLCLTGHSLTAICTKRHTQVGTGPWRNEQIFNVMGCSRRRYL